MRNSMHRFAFAKLFALLLSAAFIGNPSLAQVASKKRRRFAGAGDLNVARRGRFGHGVERGTCGRDTRMGSHRRHRHSGPRTPQSGIGILARGYAPRNAHHNSANSISRSSWVASALPASKQPGMCVKLLRPSSRFAALKFVPR